MTLINEVYRRPLDPGYAEAAERRAQGGEARRTVAAAAAVLVVAAVLGVVTTTSTLALRRPAPAVLEARALLEDEVTELTDRADGLRRSNADLAAEIAALQAQAASTDDPELFAQLQRDAVPAGVVPVQGPGLRVVLTDGQAPEGASEAEAALVRVLDVDLQILVNGLWASGAEAVAVNGERLTSTTAIRSAGAAVLVDSTAISGPYVVEAVGDAARMQTGLARSEAGTHVASLARYDIDVRMTSERLLELPGRGQVTLRSARVPGDDEGDGDVPGAGTAADDVAVSGRNDGEESL